MGETLKPRDEKDLVEAVRWAISEDHPLEVIGQGSKRDLGRPVQAGHVLDLSAISGVETYEPAELVLTVRAGTPIAEVERLVEEHGQELAFEPMDYGPLLGREPGLGTIGGVVGANLSGPKRLKHGAARDHILGLQAVSGRGEVFKAGGKVVKNVTGYDLPRALCGSWGTLALATSVTFKVLPRAQTEATVLLPGLSDAEAVRSMTRAMGSSAEVSAAAHLPREAAEKIGVDGFDGTKDATLLRLEGFGPSVDYRFDALRKLFGDAIAAERLEADVSRALWRAVRDCLPFAGDDAPVWRVSLAPTAGPAFVADLSRVLAFEAFYDWSGGLVWLRLKDGDPQAEALREGVKRAGGGHATLVRASHAVRTSVPVFEPQPKPLAGLSRRLKQQFDPSGILNPGRMASGL
ncbi:glycolate oxidase subunit GlcE [Stappia sp. GBMRC 2046]|uniref:Glycolate oxidase subunit GlcE n=1 Tax=Stappia sediminis TaxID=2692190 RepID=A0A7X3S8U7_9HYPH|nr:glycolate oxidase subunit GlcE [Stappia sediminis]MXN66193.1 glycolate oxidase subunit GlcE [Stappia sediminis]